MTKHRSGYTIVELIIMILILAILAAVAIPKYYNLQITAKTSAEQGVLGSVRAAIASFYENQCVQNNNCVYPASLDAAGAGACTTANTCFSTVLSPGVTSQWTCITAGVSYTGPTNLHTYAYTSPNGLIQ